MRAQPAQIIFDRLKLRRSAHWVSDEQLAAELIHELLESGWHLITDADEELTDEPPFYKSLRFIGENTPGDRRLRKRVQLDNEVLEQSGVIMASVRAQARDAGLEDHIRTKVGYELMRAIGCKLGLIPSASRATVAARP